MDLVSLRVRTTESLVGNTSTTIARSRIERYYNSTNIVESFLAGFKTMTTSSVVNSTSTVTNTSAVNPINVSSVTIPDTVVRSIVDLSPYKLNGNENIYSVKGNLTLDCPVSGSFYLSGVKTLIVEGNLTIMCSNGYASSDTTSSWAFIVKNGNIIINNGDGTVNNKGITNMGGVYVAIGDGTNTGKFVPLNGQTTNAILRVNGSLYGNAKPFLDSRLYVRGTTAYDILTTGIIISYSNRALVNPPPLLSQYLNTYSVTRVVR